jgi:hypothetical protein
MMGRKLASYLVLLVAGALLIYSGAMTIHLLSQTLPRGQEGIGVSRFAGL